MFTYTYDQNGNILMIRDGTYIITYQYDEANQLVRENNPKGGYTYLWTYDANGNIENRREFDYTTGTITDLSSCKELIDYHYTNTAWIDLLTGINDRSFTYDAIGNTLNDGVRTYTWRHGRELATVTKSGTTWTNTYNADGLRVKRTNGTKTYTYTYLDGALTRMAINGADIFLMYDAMGTPKSISYNGTTYLYVTNLQGDVIAVLTAAGQKVVEYSYDAWGNVLSVTGSMSSTLGRDNPHFCSFHELKDRGNFLSFICGSHKGSNLSKVKLVVHECYAGKRKSEEVFAAVFLSNAAALTPNTHSGIIKDTERS